MTDNESIFRILTDGGFSLVVRTSDGETLTFNGRGVLDIYSLLTRTPEKLKGATVADRAVGLGAAVVMAIGQIASLITPVVSADAYDLLIKHGITVEAENIAPFIINRAGTGRCPLEERLAPLGTESLEKLSAEIGEFLREKGLL